MIRLLLSCVAVLSALIQLSAAERVILWQSEAPEGVSLTWGNGDINISPEACTEFMVGGKIEIRLNKQDGAVLKLCYDKPVDGWTDLLSFPLEGENPVTAQFALTKSQVTTMKEYGFLPFGFGVSITEIAYVPSEITIDENAIWVGPKIFAQDGFDFVEIPADRFSNAKAGDKLVCMISEAQNPYIQLMFGGWEDTFFIKINNYENPERFTITENSITVTLTQEEVDKLKARGLVMPANRFVLDQLLLVPDNTTGATDLIIENNDCAVEYYNLQGVRVSNPENGIFIRRQGNKISKIIL